MKFKLLSLIYFLVLSLSAFSQFLVNQGQITLPSGYLVILGTYQNQSSGNVILDGTLKLTGNWTNNASNTGMSATNGIGTVVFNGSSLQTIGGTSTSLFNFEGITINTGASVQVQAGTGITAAGPCIFNTPLLLKSTTTPYRPKMATFINNSTVSGNITVEFSYTSNGSAAAGGHGQLFSSPVSGATSSIFGSYSTSNRTYSWDIINKYQPLTTSTALTVMKGYLYRATATNVFDFTGQPNAAASYTNSGIPSPTGTQGFFLSGNPYPAVVNWRRISTKTNLDSTYWLRCSTTAGNMVVDTWNDKLKQGTNNNGTAAIDSMIAPMQGFWVRVTTVGTSGTLTIPNSSRGHNWGNAPYLKSAEISNKDVFKFYISKGVLKDETIIAQADSASDAYDSWDSKKLFLSDNATPEIFTLAPDSSELVIQSVKPVSSEKLFPLGMYIATAENYQFQADLSQTNGLCNYYLEDIQLGIIQDLRANPLYSFSSGAVKDTFGTRFVLHINSILSTKSAESADAVSNIASAAPGLKIYSSGQDIFIQNAAVPSKIVVYNLLGIQVFNSEINSAQEVIPISSPAGIYFVKIGNSNSWKNQKVFLK